jgi:hypothetical protein
MCLLLVALAITLVPQLADCFRVDCSPEHTGKTYIRRVQQTNHMRQDHKLPPKTYTNHDRTWRFPHISSVRPIGDAKLPTLTDKDRLWRTPDPKSIRHTSTTVGTYTDQDRMWRYPQYELTRHQAQLPEPFKDEERFWWRDDKTFRNLLLDKAENDGDHKHPYPCKIM